MSEFYEFEKTQQEIEGFRWTVENLLFPALKSHFIGLDELSDGQFIVELAQLPELYKIFERC
jgi:DNA mismatch repair protein MLH1